MDASAVTHERWSPQQVPHLPPMWDLLFPWHRHQVEGSKDFLCLFRKTPANWGERNWPIMEITGGGFKLWSLD